MYKQPLLLSCHTLCYIIELWWGSTHENYFNGPLRLFPKTLDVPYGDAKDRIAENLCKWNIKGS